MYVVFDYLENDTEFVQVKSELEDNKIPYIARNLDQE